MHDGRVVLHQADCLEAMAAMDENSVDSVVCDPPYHLTSIVKRFGKDGSAPAKAGTDGAFQRASSGFMGRVWDGGDIAFQPETWAAVLRVLKPGGYIVAFASTRGFGRMSVAMEDAGFITHPMLAWIFGSGFPKATRIAADGYDCFRYGGQALKPALEPIYMGQKPFSEKTGTANILKWGTGAVNIDGCRVGDESTLVNRPPNSFGRINDDGWTPTPGVNGSAAGRWPANIVHDGSDEVLAAFPVTGMAGKLTGNEPSVPAKGDVVYGFRERVPAVHHADSGSAARFFYCAKASRADRDAGMEAKNTHPTVKPTTLMQWLCRLVTPPGGVILDPFLGSGSTGKAAVLEGFQFVGCEREDEYMPIATARIAWAIGHMDTSAPVVAPQQPRSANDNQPADLFTTKGAA